MLDHGTGLAIYVLDKVIRGQEVFKNRYELGFGSDGRSEGTYWDARALVLQYSLRMRLRGA